MLRGNYGLRNQKSMNGMQAVQDSKQQAENDECRSAAKLIVKGAVEKAVLMLEIQVGANDSCCY